MQLTPEEDFTDDLSRNVYCVLGIPVDALDMQSCLRSIEVARRRRVPFLLATPNLNFLVNSQLDSAFRNSLYASDICPADGMTIVLIARLLGVPIKSRIAGSDIFTALKYQYSSNKPLKVFFFGGTEDVDAAAYSKINAGVHGLVCVGAFCPGFGSVDEMSRENILNEINSSGADFLVVALGAKKGQSWLHRNHDRLLIPLRAHLGAVINFEAGKIRRAPVVMQNLGFEWLWRIYEEPYLWRRYLTDASAVLPLIFTRVLPLAVWTQWLRFKATLHRQALSVSHNSDSETIRVSIEGFAISPYVDKIIDTFRDVTASKKKLVIDFSKTHGVDARFLGIMLMLWKNQTAKNQNLALVGLSTSLHILFRLHGLGFLV